MRRRVVLPLLLVSLAVSTAAGCSSSGSEAGLTTTTTRAQGATTTASDAPRSASVAPKASAGCAAAPLAAGHETITLNSGGIDRSYLRYVPAGLPAGEPSPLVLDLPAYSPASLEESFSGFTTKGSEGKVRADELGAIVVTPEPIEGAGSLLTWNYLGTDGGVDDEAFVQDLLDDVEATACVDEARVLATGFAVGAVFASINACHLADRFAALATVSGLYDPEGCDPAKPLPVISFHGTGDRFVPFDGSVGAGAADLHLTAETTKYLTFMATRPGALASSEGWAKHNGCARRPKDEPVVDGVTRKAWAGCQDGADVELYVIDGGEHTWPGSTGMTSVEDLLGPVSTKIDATDLIWAFFEAHTPR